MVHVMSEVKRYDCTNGKSQYCYGCYQMEEVDEGSWVQAIDFDAQRLRADTAEALSVTNLMIDVVPGSDGMGHEVYAKSVAEVGLLISNLYLDAETAGERLAAAEQRIAEMFDLLSLVRKDGGYLTREDWDRLDTALNPNPEEESHE